MDRESEEDIRYGFLEKIWEIVKMIDSPMDEIYDFILKKILQITESQYAFWGYIDEDRNSMIIYRFSRTVSEECKTVEKPIEYPIENAGIWADSIRKRRSVIINRYENYSHKKGLPEGHVKIKRLMSIPIFVGKNLVAVVVVANKSSNYTRNDVRNVKMFMSIIQTILEKKRMEKALEEERNLFVHGPVVIFKWKAEEQQIPIEYVSPNIKNVFGYDAGDFITGKIRYEDIIHPDDLKKVIGEVEYYRKRGLSHFEQKYRIIDARGEIRWVHDFTAVSKNKKGEITHYHGYLMDITGKRAMEEDLENSNRLLKMMYRCNKALIFAKTRKRLINKICRAIVEEGGYSLVWTGIMDENNTLFPATMVGKSKEFVNKIKTMWGEDYPMEFATTAINTGKPYVSKEIKEDGRCMEFKSCIALPLKVNEKIIGSLNIYSENEDAFNRKEIAFLSQLANDIAYGIFSLEIREKKRKIEKKLEKERRQLLSIFEGIDEPIYVADPETHEILYINNALEKLIGGKAIGRKCYRVFQGLNQPCDFCTNKKILGENFGKTYVWEFQNKLTGRWYRCFDRGIIWPDGRKVRLEIAMDISDRVEAEERWRKALKQERKFKLDTAHYFFNPIAIAKGYLEIVLEDKKDVDKNVRKAIEAIERVENVVKNVTQKGEIHE